MFDVAIIGGGPAGLNAALVLARSRRQVVVIDGGQPRNAPAAAMHGFLTRDGTPPQELLALGRAEVAGYGAHLVDGTVTAVETHAGPTFDLTLADGRTLSARRLLVTTGLVDELPDVPGVQALWGDQVIHCPYCHGWEVRDQAIGVISTSPMSIHQALLFHQLSDDVVLFSHSAPPSDEQRADLEARGIPVIDHLIAELHIEHDRLTGIRLDNGELVPRQAVVVAPRFVARSTLLEQLGVELAEGPAGGTRAVAEPTGKTNVPGVWVAGNVTDHSATVLISAAAGAFAGAHINADLVMTARP